jgi:hypothetical protein
MNKVAIALIAAFLVGPSALAQSFNGAGRMSAGSPTGWAPNPNGYVGTPYGASYGSQYGGQFGGQLYGRYPGGGAYNGGLVGPVYPFGTPYVNPVAMGNGLYSFNGGGINANMWRAPSGYYYPWGVGSNYNGYQQIIYVDQSGGRSQTVAQQPPLSMQFTDMSQFLDDAHKNGKLADNDFQSLKRRLKDIQSKERSYRIAGDGYLEDNYDAEIKQNLKDLSKEMTERIKL